MEQMKQIIDVHTGDVQVATGQILLRSTGIGSCIVVTAIDFGKNIGGMAHVMLPGTAPENAEKRTNYAFDGISQLLREMQIAGAERNNLEVCLVGAGNVLKKENDTICDSNIKSVMRILDEYNITIKASVLGGFKRKSINLDIESGVVTYTEGDGQEDILWQAKGNLK